MSEKDKVQYIYIALSKELQIGFLLELNKIAENYYGFIKYRNIFIRCVNDQRIIQPQNNHNKHNNYNDPLNFNLVLNRSNKNKNLRQNNFQRKRNPNKYYHIYIH